MIVIEYEHGDISLLAACAAAKQLIQYRPTGTKCVVRSVSKKMTLIMTFVVDANSCVTEETDMLSHEKLPLGSGRTPATPLAFGGLLHQVGNSDFNLQPIVINDSMLGDEISPNSRYLFDPRHYNIVNRIICAHPEGRKIDRFPR